MYKWFARAKSLENSLQSYNYMRQSGGRYLFTPRIFVPVYFEYLRMRDFSVFSIVHIVLEEFDCTARVQYELVGVARK